MASNFATLGDIETLWRNLTPAESTRATALLEIVSNVLRNEADKVGKNLDEMIADKPALESVVKSVVVDIVSRTLSAPTDELSLSQFSQSALGYTVSGTYANGGGGLYVKKSELARIGLTRQRLGGVCLC